MTAREVLDGIKDRITATNIQRIDLDEPGVRYAPTIAPMESLLDTRTGMALANAAWQEGASAAIRYCNDDDAVTKPVSPYSAPLLKMIKSGAAAAPVDVARLTRAIEDVLAVADQMKWEAENAEHGARAAAEINDGAGLRAWESEKYVYQQAERKIRAAIEDALNPKEGQ